MGSWGPGLFDNDGALDFVGDLQDSPRSARWKLTADTIRAAAGKHYQESVAACEMLAFWLGQGSRDSVALARRYGLVDTPTAPTPALVEQAVRYLERIGPRGAGFIQPANERDWKANIRDLAHRLRTATIQTRRYPGWSLTSRAPSSSPRLAKRALARRARSLARKRPPVKAAVIIQSLPRREARKIKRALWRGSVPWKASTPRRKASGRARSLARQFRASARTAVRLPKAPTRRRKAR